MSATTRRRFLLSTAVALPALLLAPTLLLADDAGTAETVTITQGDLKVILRDNSRSPRVLSGVASMRNLKDAPDFEAFDPGRPGASAGLNFEHVISGHKNENNSFTPRKGKFALSVLPDGKSAMLVRNREDDPWSISSTLKYTVTKPHYIDVDFRCIPHDRALFGERGYAILFFANYMNDVEQVALNFRGVDGPNQEERWIVANKRPDWHKGGTYRSLPASDLAYDADHNFSLNSWSYDYPRFTRPFYFGRAAHGMVFILMFNKIYTDEDEIRFSLFKFKLRHSPRPAWDFQYVIRKIEEEKEYGFKARLVWKKFVSPEDCLNEYETWRSVVEP